MALDLATIIEFVNKTGIPTLVLLWFMFRLEKILKKGQALDQKQTESNHALVNGIKELEEMIQIK